MDIKQALQDLKDKALRVGDHLETEEATKNALIMPFLTRVLGYDVFDPEEVRPEYNADVGTKKGEKVDYAIFKEGAVQILIECKAFRGELGLNHAAQLYRYFSVTNARVAILTNGQVYQFYTDLDAPNKMDKEPFMTVDIFNVDGQPISELKKLSKQDFDVDSVINVAGELKYMSAIKRVLSDQFENPDEELVKFFGARVYDGMLTQKVKDQLRPLIKKAMRSYFVEGINARLKSALGEDVSTSDVDVITEKNDDGDATEEQGKPNVVTTEDEMEGFRVVQAIVRKVLPLQRVYFRDTQSYFGVNIDDNNRKPLCRLHFNGKSKWYLGLFDEDKKEDKVLISSVDDIYLHADEIIESAMRYTEEKGS